MKLEEIIQGVQDIIRGYLEIEEVIDKPLSEYESMDSLTALGICKGLKIPIRLLFRPVMNKPLCT